MKVLELGHDKIVHEIDKDQNKENPKKEFKIDIYFFTLIFLCRMCLYPGSTN